MKVCSLPWQCFCALCVALPAAQAKPFPVPNTPTP